MSFFPDKGFHFNLHYSLEHLQEMRKMHNGVAVRLAALCVSFCVGIGLSPVFVYS